LSTACFHFTFALRAASFFLREGGPAYSKESSSRELSPALSSARRSRGCGDRPLLAPPQSDPVSLSRALCGTGSESPAPDPSREARDPLSLGFRELASPQGLKARDLRRQFSVRSASVSGMGSSVSWISRNER
jgi:hypothetical protein